MHYKRIIAGAAISSMLLPSLALAQEMTLEAQIKSLVSQINTLQMQLKTLLSSSSSSPMFKIEHKDEVKKELREHLAPGQIAKERCIMLNRDLRMGSQGEDVKKLQEMLAADTENGFHGKATGFFGPLTATAMAKFQMRMGIASSTDGVVGKMTRGFFERACGKGLGMHADMVRAAIAGEITAVSNSSIEVSLRGGETRTVAINASTTIHVMTVATASPAVGTFADLVVGKMVRAEGVPQQDGSLLARQIKVEPKK